MNKLKLISNILLMIIISLVNMSCAFETKSELSQLVVLYRDSIVEGNSMVSFISHDDPTGEWAMKHCENLKKLYMRDEAREYICSTFIFENFRPKIKQSLPE